MMAAEWLASMRDCALQVRREEQRIERLRGLLGPHGRGARFSAESYADPMRHVDDFMDAEAEARKSIDACDRELDKAWLLVAGIEAYGGDDAAQVVTRYYLWAEEWEQVARETGRTPRLCRMLCAQTLEWIDRVGIANVMQKGRDSNARSQCGYGQRARG